jgi:myo-inositol-1(or 4)-monophosphatase
MSTGVIVLQEAGGVVTQMDGKAYSVFQPSILACGPGMHAPLLEFTRPVIQRLQAAGVDLSPFEMSK